MNHGLDTNIAVFFYEPEFYVLSNFSAFRLSWKQRIFPTSEHAYQWEKFVDRSWDLQHQIQHAPSAHEAFKLAETHAELRRDEWDAMKTTVMLDILRAKVAQHEYVRRKLLETGNRNLIENSWRDDYWGWGPNKDGHNMLGQLWTQIRKELRRDQIQTGVPDL